MIEIMNEREGQLVKEYQLGSTQIKVRDDFYYTMTGEEGILLVMANKVQALLISAPLKITRGIIFLW